ncbi:hypothetical protein [Tenacibaculum jejuense]|uniref:Uncharacterized protein n=1 Tax=Tenacibaculum jejuense TaxID=584609 RepID=A0A238UBN8_9FLAO|nr:hypothetical protein [Tenacibaculum jejuense]SNR16589.1 Protein of unknown function precursor [Tenacibaculum jejuense]
MSRKIKSILLTQLIIIVNFSFGQTSSEKASVRNIKNYNNWKWDKTFVAKNKFISVAVVPDAAGRVLEYNLGDVPSLWINPKLFGKSFSNNEHVKMTDWRNFGGYRLVPIPVKNCAVNKNGKKVKRWPPPVSIGDAPYQAEIIKKDDFTSIKVTSGVQNLPVPKFDYKSKSFSIPEKIEEQFQYSRSLHIEDNSSLVFIDHTLTNKGINTIQRGLKISSQHVSRSKPELEDGENFVAHIPFSKEFKLPDGKQFHISVTPESRWRYINRNRMKLDKNNPEHIKKYFNHGTNWTGEVSPGIYETHYDYYLMGGIEMISSKSWLSYVNKTNNTAFVKMFEPYNPKLTYEDGANSVIFHSGLEDGYLETEVKTPIYTLKPNESFNYKEIHGAAKVTSTPILDVNQSGIITQRLSLNKKTKTVTGEYGVFKAGKAILRIVNNAGKTEDISIADVDPLHAFSLNISSTKITKAKTILLFIKSKNNYYTLDKLAI